MIRLALAVSVVALLAGCSGPVSVDGAGEPGGKEVSMQTRQVMFRGNPVTLEGSQPKVGDTAPDFIAVANDMSDKRLSDFRGKTVLLTTVPSLDTPVCDTEMRTFNERAASLPGDTVVVTVSMDLPFAQKRWCGAAGVEDVITLSDYKYREVAENYGIRLSELGLLARAVWVIGPDGVIRYRELVAEQTHEPDYDAALAAAR
jgi:thiol peroxidase